MMRLKKGSYSTTAHCCLHSYWASFIKLDTNRYIRKLFEGTVTQEM